MRYAWFVEHGMCVPFCGIMFFRWAVVPNSP